MEVRLQKYMASCGVASRRKCEEIILAGDVTVNGNIIMELGTKIVDDIDVVKVKGKVIKREEIKRYIMLNKPEGYICSVKDEKNRKTVLDIVKVSERIYPIGRLDYDSSGLLLLTNDGAIYNKIIHPRVMLNKKYLVVCEGVFTDKELIQFTEGIDIGGYITAPAKVKVLKVHKDNFSNKTVSTLEIIIHEGKNRQVRRMCSAVNHEVLSLKRIQIGEIKLKDLKRGDWRELTDKEINFIKSL